MASEVTSIGVSMETDGVERGIRTLQQLATQGPRVEKSMQGIEAAASKADKSLNGIGAGADRGLKAIAGSASGAEQGLSRVGKSAEDTKRYIDNLHRSITGMGTVQTAPLTRSLDSVKTSALGAGKAVDLLKSTLAVTGIGIGVKEVINLADGYTKFTAQLKLASKSADDYAASMTAVRRISLDAQQGLAETGTLYARIANGTAELGLSQQKLSDITETVALGLKVSGATASESASAMLQLSQAFASGVLRGEEFNAVNESAPRLMKALADGIGVPVGALRELASEGKITSQVMADALPKALESIRKEAEQIQTIGGSFTILKNNLLEFVGAGDKASGATKAISASVTGLANNLDTIAVAAGGLALIIAGRYVGAMTAASASTVAMAASTVRANVAAVALSASISPAAAAVSAFGVAARGASAALALFGGPIGLAVTAIGAATAAFLYFRDTTEETIESIGGLNQPLEDLKKKLDELPPEKRVSVIIDIEKSGREAIKEADRDIEALVQSVAGAANIKMPLDEFEKLTDSIRDTAKSGGDLTPILQKAAQSGGIPQSVLQSWLNLAANIREAHNAAANAAGAVGSTMSGAGGDVADVFIGPTDTALRKEAEAVLKTTAAYKSRAEQMAEVSKQADVLKASIDKLKAAGLDKSDEVKGLQSRLDGVNERLASMAKSGRSASGGVKQVENAYSTLSKRVNEYIEQLRIEATQSDKVSTAQKLQIQLDDLLVKSKGKVTAAKIASLKADIQTARAMEEEAKAVKRTVEAYQDYIRDQEAIARADVELSKAKEALWKSIADQNIELENQSRMLELEASNIGKSAYERTIANEVLKAQIELEKELRGISNNTEYDAPTKAEAEAAARARAVKKIALAERKAYVTEWEKTSQTIGDTLADYIMGGGKDAAQYLKRLFSTLVLQPVVQTAVGSIFGGSGGAGGSLGGMPGGSLTDWSKLGGTAADLLFDQGVGMSLKGFESLGSSMQRLGVTIGRVDSYLKDIPGMSGGIGSAAGYLGSIYSLTQGNYGAAIGSAIGTYILPGIGTMIGSTLGGLLDGLDDSGTPHMGGSAMWSAATGGKTNLDLLNTSKTDNPLSNIDNQFASGFGWVQDREEVRTALSGLAQGIGSSLDSFAKSFGSAFGYEVALGFADDTSKDGAWGALRIALGEQEIVNWNDSRQSKWAPRSFSDGEEGYKQFLNDVFLDVKSALVSMDLPAWADQILDASSDIDTINASLQQISATRLIFDQLGKSMEMFSGISGDLQTQLLAASGGIESLSANAGTFYQGFYSEQERMEALQKQLRDTLTGFDLSIDPAMGDEAKEQFRATVEAAMAGGQGELASQLLAMSGSFATAADYAQKSAEDAAQAAQEAAQAIAQQWKDLENRVLAVQDKYRTPEQRLSAQYESIAGGLISAGLSNMQQGDLSSMLMQSSKDEIYALAQEVWNLGHLSIDARNALLDAADALADLKDAAKQQRDGLMSTLWQMTGNTQALREKELAALDPSNRALQAMIYALGDLQNAATEAAQKTQAAWSSWSTASSLAMQYTGDTSGMQAQAAILRAQLGSAGVVDTAKLQELIGIEQSLFNVQKQKQEEAQRLQSQITQERLSGLRDELAAARAMADAAKRLGDYARDLYSSEASGLSESERMAALFAEYGALKNAARSGNVDAFGKLQSVTGDYLGLAGTLASSGSDYSITAGRMAAELEALAKAQELVGQSQATGLERQMERLTAQNLIAQEQFAVSSDVKALIAKSMQEQADIWEREKAQAGILNGMQERMILEISSLPMDFGETMSPMLINAASSIERPISERLDILIEAVYQGYAANSEGAVRVPAYAVGTNVVPRDMLAQIHEGEAIIPKAFNPWAGGTGFGGGGAADKALVAEIRALREQNARLEERLKGIERSSQQLADQFDNVTAGGNAMATEVMA